MPNALEKRNMGSYQFLVAEIAESGACSFFRLLFMLICSSVTTAKRFPFLKFLDMFQRGGSARNFYPEL